MKEYNVGTSNLPEYIRIILSQTKGVNDAALIHDLDYGLGYYVNDEGIKIKLSRKDSDLRFRDNILKNTGDLELAEAYHKIIKKTGAYGWYRAKIMRIIKYLKGELK